MSRPAPITTPTRRLIGLEISPRLDEHGFLASDFAAQLPTLDSMQNSQTVLVVAPPWTGKTHEADQFLQHLRTDRTVFGDFVESTPFERSGPKPDMTPSWWDDWRDQDDQLACWVIDALDEDERSYGMHAILDLIEDLTPAQRGRLFLLMFCRENERPRAVEDRLVGIYGSSGPGGLEVMKLAPVCESIARAITKLDTHAFGRMCRLILRNNLQAVASLPIVLENLAGQAEDTAIEMPDLWRGVLFSVLQDRRRDERYPCPLSPLADRFQAATRIAAALTFSGHTEVDAGRSDSRGPGISIPFSATAPNADRLSRAASDVIRSTAFRRMATGYQFAQSHVREWLTAFELRAVSLPRLRPLVSDEYGKPYPRLRGVLGILHDITTRDDVRNWIKESHGGVVPRSDAAPWSLEAAVRVLDQLQEVARNATHGPVHWGDRNLSQLKAPGLGKVLSKRIANRSLSLAERELLIDVAQATSDGETSSVARSMVLDVKEDEHLRLSAAYLLRDVGTDDDVRGIESLVLSHQPPSSRDTTDMISALIGILYDRGIWAFAQAVKYLPDNDDTVMGTTEMLAFQLQENMSIEDAREFLRTVDWKSLATSDKPASSSSRPYSLRNRLKLIVRALSLAAKQEELQWDDYQLLIPVVLLEYRIRKVLEWPTGWPSGLTDVFSRNQDARREVYIAGFRSDPDVKQRSPAWRWVLQADDIDWLVTFYDEHGSESTWLWEQLLALAYSPDVTQSKRNAIRKMLRGDCPNEVAEFDRNRRKFRAQESRHLEAEQRREEERRAEQYKLPSIIRDTLDHPEMGLHKQMVRLSWFCFVEKRFRPTNVVGEWDDLKESLKSEVLAVVEEALVTSKPTDIPVGSSFPGTVLYEGTAFAWLLRNRETYRPDSTQIKKWLQAVFKMSSPSDEIALNRCRDVEQKATEDVILKEIRREMLSERGSVVVAANLPSEFWSDRLATRAARMVSDDGFEVSVRVALLRVLVRHAPEHVRGIVEIWVNLPADETDTTQLMRTAGLDSLLVIDAERAVSELVRRCNKQGSDLLLEMSSLGEPRSGPSAAIKTWPSSLLEQLGDLLHRMFPVSSDPVRESGQSYFVTREDDLRDLRSQIPRILLERDSPEDHAILKRLSEKHDAVRRWYSYIQSQQTARGILEFELTGKSPAGSASGAVPVAKVIRLLDDAVYRLIRSSRDLQRVLLEEIDEIEKNVKIHLSMLYRPVGRSGEQRRRLHEDALQAYLHCRLNDRLVTRVLDAGTQVIMNREALAPKGQRVDIKVEALTVRGSPATVVLELKWSDNPDVSTSLVEQLGEEYLVGQSLTHGIYLVGWNGHGHWRNDASGPKPRRPYTLVGFLAPLCVQAEEYKKTRPDVVIIPKMIDLQWNVRE